MMNANDYWTMFMQTGAPAIYLMYKNAKHMEDMHVSDDAGARGTGYGVQGAGLTSDTVNP